MLNQTKVADMAATLDMFAEQATPRQEYFDKYDDKYYSRLDDDSDDDCDCPIFKRFFIENGSQTIMDTTNFTLNEFNSI